MELASELLIASAALCPAGEETIIDSETNTRPCSDHTSSHLCTQSEALEVQSAYITQISNEHFNYI